MGKGGFWDCKNILENTKNYRNIYIPGKSLVRGKIHHFYYNHSGVKHRGGFVKDIFKLNSILQSLNTKRLLQYIINITDTLIIKSCAKYCYIF